MERLKIIFVGTPDFGVPALEKLAEDNGFKILAAISQPDLPSGRNKEVLPTPIKKAAQKINAPVFQPQKIIQITDELRALKPDFLIVAAYAQIIPPEILKIPRFGCVNIHASLLPKYRGASPIQAAILSGDAETGATIMLMDEKLDTGDILGQIIVKIKNNDTTNSLYEKISRAGAQIIGETLKKFVAGEIKPLPQNHNLANYVRELKKEDGLIDWSRNAEQIEKFVRAMNSWPIAWTWWKGRQIKIIETESEIIEIDSQKPGKTFRYNNGLAIQCGKNSLIIKKLKLEGRKEMTAEEFLNGQHDFIGSILG